MKVSHTYFLALVIIITLLSSQAHAQKPESPDYTQYADEVTSIFLKQTYKEYGIECGATGGKMPHDVEEISVQLTAYRKANIEQARELEIILTEKFAQIINAHEKIRPFLREYPFPPTRVRISIFFADPKRKKKDPFVDDEVTFVFQVKNKIFYQNEKPSGQYQYTDIMNESYEEAHRIVQRNALKKP